MLSKIFQHQQLLKYSILICINCTCYTKGKAIFSEIFRHQRLPKYSIFMCIYCAYYSEGKTIFSEIFQHQLPPKDFIFTRIQCMSSPSHKQHFLGILALRTAEIFYFCAHYQVHILHQKQTNSRPNVTLSHAPSAHITPKAKKYSSKYSSTNNCRNIPLSCVFRAHFIPKAKQYSLKHFGTNSCRNIPFLCVLIAHITPKANNILRNISAPTAAERLYFHMDSMHMFPGPQTIFPRVFRPQEPMLFSPILSEHITRNAKQYSLKYSGTNSC